MAPSGAEVMQICEIFRAKVVDVTKRSVIVEVTGTTDKVEAFERMVRPFGLIEMMRTGEIAISAAAANLTRGLFHAPDATRERRPRGAAARIGSSSAAAGGTRRWRLPAAALGQPVGRARRARRGVVVAGPGSAPGPSSGSPAARRSAIARASAPFVRTTSMNGRRRSIGSGNTIVEFCFGADLEQRLQVAQLQRGRVAGLITVGRVDAAARRPGTRPRRG